MRRILPLLLLLALAGWVALRHYRQQQHLHQQLEQLTAVLTIENDLVAKQAQNTIKGIEAAVAKNRNQPVDIALLQRAEALQTSVNKLIDALRNYGGQLHHTNTNFASSWLLQPSTKTADTGTLRQQDLRKQVAAYADTLRALALTQADAAPLVAPGFNEATPAVEAIADLNQLESEVLARQAFALQRIVKSVGARSWLTRPLLTASAESNVVAPGATYRAQLGLWGYFSAAELKMAMTCNGQPVPAGPNGTGLVRFRAPTHPGHAAWTGTIRINQNGRDATFKVTVPYRVFPREPSCCFAITTYCPPPPYRSPTGALPSAMASLKPWFSATTNCT